MELFIPSILVLVLAAVIIFLVLPKMSPYLLGGMALILLVVGIVQHYQTFPYEYSASNIQHMIGEYSSFVILGVLIVGLLVVIGGMFGMSAPSMASVLPAAVAGGNTAAAAPAANNKGGVLNGVMNTLGLNGGNGGGRPANNKGGVLNGVMNTLGLAGNNRKNGGGGILGNRFTTV